MATQAPCEREASTGRSDVPRKSYTGESDGSYFLARLDRPESFWLGASSSPSTKDSACFALLLLLLDRMRETSAFCCASPGPCLMKYGSVHRPAGRRKGKRASDSDWPHRVNGSVPSAGASHVSAFHQLFGICFHMENTFKKRNTHRKEAGAKANDRLFHNGRATDRYSWSWPRNAGWALAAPAGLQPLLLVVLVVVLVAAGDLRFRPVP